MLRTLKFYFNNFRSFYYIIKLREFINIFSLIHVNNTAYTNKATKMICQRNAIFYLN